MVVLVWEDAAFPRTEVDGNAGWLGFGGGVASV